MPKLHSASLVSQGQLRNDNCKIELDKDTIKVFKNKNKLLQCP